MTLSDEALDYSPRRIRCAQACATAGDEVLDTPRQTEQAATCFTFSIVRGA